jgi:hypothetical protein
VKGRGLVHNALVFDVSYCSSINTQPVDDLRETLGHWKLKEEALDRNMWKNGFGNDIGLSEDRLWNE